MISFNGLKKLIEKIDNKNIIYLFPVSKIFANLAEL
jgi:hypothetical protein